MSKPNLTGTASRKQQADAELQAQAEQQLNQLLAEVRMLESYFEEATGRVQAASSALTDTRSAIDALNGIALDTRNEFLIPIGGGLLLPVKDVAATRVVLSIGAGVAMEKDFDSAKAYLQTRQKELEKALSTLEQQRREIGARLDRGRAVLQQISGQG